MASPSGAPPMAPPSPPYPPTTAQLGSLPTTNVDVPICAVLLPCYVAFAAFNMTRYQLNNRRGHKFLPSAALFGFCMSRTAAFVLRIVWAVYPTNSNVSLASGIFTNAGVIVFFVVNIIFAQRVVRAFHPAFGWSRPITYVFRSFFVLFFCGFAMLIVSIIWSAFTLDQGLASRLRVVRLVAATLLALLAFLPAPITLISAVVPRSGPIDKFGRGRMRTKIYVLIFSSLLLSVGAGFRCGIAYVVRPLTNPGWFNSKAAFYCFNFAIELTVLSTYAIVSFDKRFHIPNGSGAPGHYSKGVPDKDSEPAMSEDVPLGTERPQTTDQQREQERAWESRLQNELEMERAV